MEIHLFQQIARLIPNLHLRLREAGLREKPEIFLKKILLTTLYLTLGINLFIFLVFVKYGYAKIVYYSFPLMFIILFFYLLKLPEVTRLKREKEIDREIVFAGRFLIVEIESGVALYDAFRNIAKNYQSIGPYFSEIVNKVDLGINMEKAIGDVIDLNPSNDLRRILWQILNAMRTGGDVAKSLTSTLEQIHREQMIKVQEYSRKLNPLAMFYMIVAVIMPSLGIAMLIMFSVFINIELNLTILLIITLLIGFIQFMFLAVIRFSRPAVEIS